jgi:GcrA cell cycle regulator
MNWTEERIAELHALAAQRLSAQQIGDALGISRNAAIGATRRFGVKLLLSAGWHSINQAKGDNAPLAKQDIPKLPKPSKPAEQAEPASFRTGAPEPLSRHVSLLELRDRDCKWPSGDAPADITFCGAPRFRATPAEDALPYCPYHCALAFVPHAVRGRVDRRIGLE